MDGTIEICMNRPSHWHERTDDDDPHKKPKLKCLKRKIMRNMELDCKILSGQWNEWDPTKASSRNDKNLNENPNRYGWKLHVVPKAKINFFSIKQTFGLTCIQLVNRKWYRWKKKKHEISW